MTPTPTPATPEHTFNGLGISPNILDILGKLNFTTPTPIQYRAIPEGVAGKDVVGVAQTGTGKTLAFGIPLLQRLAAGEGRGLILVPTRELALQVEETLSKVARPLGMRTTVFIGGASMGMQISSLRRDPHVIIATPGRLLDHLAQKTLKLDMVEVLILDEADRMLDMGFWPQVKKIIAAAPSKRQTMLFSATLSKEIMQLATQHMKLPLRIEVAPAGTTVAKVTQEFFIVRKEDKGRLLEKILGDYAGSTLVFSRTKHGAKRIMRTVASMGHTAAEIHGNRSLSQRREALDGFKNGKYRVLVATDIASRGIDVKGIELVINYDLPMDTSDYVHRIGRTARAGAEGHAISFAEPHQKREIRDIEHLIRKTVPISVLPALPPARAAQPYVDDDRPRRFSRPQPGGFTPRGGSGFGSRPRGTSSSRSSSSRAPSRGPRRFSR